MADGSSLWALATVLGPIILIVAIVWAIFHNRRSARENAETEAATARNYDEQDRIDKDRQAR